MSIINNFKPLDLHLTLHEFYKKSRTGDSYNLRFVREPGSMGITLVEYFDEFDRDAGIPVEEKLSLIMETDEAFAKDFLDIIKEAFNIPCSDGDEDPAAFQVDELFILSITGGLILLETAPYFEVELDFRRLEDGFVAELYLVRTSFNKETQVIGKSVLYQSTYPLSQPEEIIQGEDKGEADDLDGILEMMKV